MDSIGVLADTHCERTGATDLPDAVLNALRPCSLILHCGDIVHPDTLARLAAVAPVKAVRSTVDPSSDVPGLFESGFLDGSKHPLSLGLTEDIPYFKNQERLTFARVGLTDPLSLEEYTGLGGYRGLRNALALKGPEIVKEVTESGLRGRGGAGFPTGIKWKTALDAPSSEKYVVCNADEGDSGTFSDRMIMEGDPFVLIEGMTIAGLAINASDSVDRRASCMERV